MKRLLILLMLLPIAGLSQEEKLQTVTSELAPGIYRIYYTSRVALVAFTGEDGLMLVDAAYKRSGDVILEELEKIGVNSVRYIVNTHWHGDHTGGNIPLGEGVDIMPSLFISAPSVLQRQDDDPF